MTSPLGTFGITATIDFYEVVWVALAAAGMVLHRMGWRKAVRELVGFTQRSINGSLLREVRKFRRNERFRFWKQLGFLAVGVIAMTNPPGPVTWKSLLVRFIFIGIEIGLIFCSYKDNYDYDQSIAEGRAQEAP